MGRGSWGGHRPIGHLWDPTTSSPCLCLPSLQCVGPLEEKIECMGDPDEAKLEFGEYWDMMGDAAKGCRRK